MELKHDTGNSALINRLIGFIRDNDKKEDWASINDVDLSSLDSLFDDNQFIMLGAKDYEARLLLLNGEDGNNNEILVIGKRIIPMDNAYFETIHFIKYDADEYYLGWSEFKDGTKKLAIKSNVAESNDSNDSRSHLNTSVDVECLKEVIGAQPISEIIEPITIEQLIERKKYV